MANPRRTEPLRAARTPEAPAPQPVYLQRPQNYQPDGAEALLWTGLAVMGILGTALGVLIGWGMIVILPAMLLGIEDSPVVDVLVFALSVGTYAYLTRHWLSARFPKQYGGVVAKLKEWS